MRGDDRQTRRRRGGLSPHRDRPVARRALGGAVRGRSRERRDGPRGVGRGPDAHRRALGAAAHATPAHFPSRLAPRWFGDAVGAPEMSVVAPAAPAAAAPTKRRFRYKRLLVGALVLLV